MEECACKIGVDASWLLVSVYNTQRLWAQYGFEVANGSELGYQASILRAGSEVHDPQSENRVRLRRSERRRGKAPIFICFRMPIARPARTVRQALLQAFPSSKIIERQR